MWGEGGVAGSQPMSTVYEYIGAQINFGDLTPNLTYVCNINIVYRKVKSENSQDYAQKPQRNFTFMNSASGFEPRVLPSHVPY
jgi:hypothetical protein